MSGKRKEAENSIELIRIRKKKFVRIREGALLYSLGIQAFTKLARNAGATYKFNHTVLVNTDIVDRYLERFKEDNFFEY